MRALRWMIFVPFVVAVVLIVRDAWRARRRGVNEKLITVGHIKYVEETTKRVQELRQRAEAAEAECAKLRAHIESDPNHIAYWRERLDTMRIQLDAARAALRGLLAIIHRDGGHHTAAVGDEQSVRDAHEVWAKLMSQAETLRGLREKMEALPYHGNSMRLLRSDVLALLDGEREAGGG